MLLEPRILTPSHFFQVVPRSHKWHDNSVFRLYVRFNWQTCHVPPWHSVSLCVARGQKGARILGPARRETTWIISSMGNIGDEISQLEWFMNLSPYVMISCPPLPAGLFVTHTRIPFFAHIHVQAGYSWLQYLFIYIFVPLVIDNVWRASGLLRCGVCNGKKGSHSFRSCAISSVLRGASRVVPSRWRPCCSFSGM